VWEVQPAADEVADAHADPAADGRDAAAAFGRAADGRDAAAAFGRAADGRDAAAAFGRAADVATTDGASGPASLRDAPTFSLCSDQRVAQAVAAECIARVQVATAVRDRLSGDALSLAEKVLTDDAVTRVAAEGLLRDAGMDADAGDDPMGLVSSSTLEAQAVTSTPAVGIDSAYIAAEVRAELQAIGLIDRLLSPSARDALVVDLVARARELTAEHLAVALSAQSKGGRACE
jgi:hypothetical protein